MRMRERVHAACICDDFMTWTLLVQIMRFSFQPLLVFRAMQNQMTGIGQSVQSWQARERERERGVSRGEKAWMKAHRDEGKVRAVQTLSSYREKDKKSSESICTPAVWLD